MCLSISRDSTEFKVKKEKKKKKVVGCINQIDRILMEVEWDEILLFLMQNTNIWAEERSEKAAVFIVSPISHSPPFSFFYNL